MLIVHVHIRVRPESIERFLEATVANAGASIQEPGVLAFDVLADEADPAHIVLVEKYRDDDAAAAHRQTEHYAVWRDAVEDMMAQPRDRARLRPVFPTS